MHNKTVQLDHGSGGLASQELIGKLFLKYLDNSLLHDLEDSALLERPPGRLAFTTDSYVVDPLFFPGGDIGKLAVHGTINDLAMRGATPLYLSLGLILEEGLSLDDLERIIVSIASCCKDTGVPIVTGDTKVVPKGKGDRIFINTSGIGVVADNINISSKNGRPGDAVLLSGSMGDHGITIMTRRAGIGMDGNLASDTMPLHRLTRKLLAEIPLDIRTMRDPTRGGVATSLNEIAANSRLSITIDEDALPVAPEVRVACELLGLEPLYLANEGKCLVIVSDEMSEAALSVMRSLPEGKDAVRIGTLQEGFAGRVTLQTPIGGTRIVTPLHGAPLPRIC